MEKFIVVPYILQGKEGKIIVRDGKTEEEIKEICVIDSKSQEIKNLIKDVEIKEKTTWERQIF